MLVFFIELGLQLLNMDLKRGWNGGLRSLLCENFGYFLVKISQKGQLILLEIGQVPLEYPHLVAGPTSVPPRASAVSWRFWSSWARGWSTPWPGSRASLASPPLTLVALVAFSRFCDLSENRLNFLSEQKKRWNPTKQHQMTATVANWSIHPHIKFGPIDRTKNV